MRLGRAGAVLAVVVLAQISFALLLRGIPGLVPEIREEFDVSVATVGLAVFAPGLGLLLTMLAWGSYADRHGERWAFPVGFLGLAVALAVAAAATSFAVLFGALVVAGALGGVTTNSSRAVSAWFPTEQRARAVSLVITGLSIGGAIGAIGFAGLGEIGGMPLGLGVVAGASAGTAVALAIVLRPAPGEAEARATRRRRWSPRDRRLWSIIVGQALVTFAALAVMGYVPLYLHEERGIATVIAGLALAISYLLQAVLRVAVAAVADRIGNRMFPAFVLCAIGSAALFVFAVSLDAPRAVVYLLAVLAPALAFSANGLTATAVAEIVPADVRGRALAVRNTVVLGAGAFGPVAFGAVASGIGYGTAIAMSAAVAAIGTAVFLGDLGRRAAPAPTGERPATP